MSLTPAHFRRQVEAGQAVRRAAHEAEAARQSGTSFGVDLGPFRELTDAEIDAEAARRFAGWSSPEAALKRAVLAMALTGDYEADAVLSAMDRGDAGSAERAQALVAARTQKAA